MPLVKPDYWREGLSRLRGNLHERFLGEEATVTYASLPDTLPPRSSTGLKSLDQIRRYNMGSG
jgi:hypothetical protein